MTVGGINQPGSFAVWRPARVGVGAFLRRMFPHVPRRFVLTLCGALALATMAAPARAVDWLVLVVDRSNSIDADELHLQRQAYVDVLNDGKIVRALKHTLIAIVEFDSTATIVVPWTTARDAAARPDRARRSARTRRPGRG